MNELTRPFVQLWDWCGYHGGFAGQAFLVVLVVIAIMGVLTWLGNRR